ncbi:4Fe-4S dicluster domain-containing protein [Clostridium gasigenes]|uniref:4Fe-4S dicluster domain-containing protein n=1 Tax=Clostridium gasigenes TaxID=94869 RepID=UPI001C0E0974|nr:4Fe-4S dicluster domain-containing protein [Clostridium gasigenes]MBU3132559.1 4Fe-4S dicluster domain-containing protein [Clostridium gasigenes]
MIGNILSNVKISTRNFKLMDNTIQSISEDKRETVSMNCNIDKMNYEEVLKNIKEYSLVDNKGIELYSKYESKRFKSIVIKAFSINPNLNGYVVIAEAKREELELGLKVIKKLFKDVEVKFAIDGTDKKITPIVSGLGQVIKVNKTLDLYDEKLQIKGFGKDVSTEDILIEDLFTLIYLGKAFKDGDLNKEVYLTIYGGAVEGNKVVSVNSGTSLNDIFVYLNGDKQSLKKVIIGGALNGEGQYNLDGAVNNSMRGILFLTEKESPSEDDMSCIRCSKCLRICPEGLNPIKLKELWNRNEKDEFLKFGGEKCIECGLCSYVCPSNIEIIQAIRTGKVFINK